MVVHADEIESLRFEIQHLGDRVELADWLRKLRERLRNGMDCGVYREESNPEQWEKAEPGTAPELRCLRDFINLERPATTLSCCDDRMLSRLSHLGQSEVVGLSDLLWNLRDRGALSSEQLFAYCHRLRAANVRYVPVTVDEIVHYIRGASVEDEELIETAELTTLRRYVAACLLDWNLLQRLPPNHPEALERSEILFIPGLQNTIQNAIRELWNDALLSPAACIAGSDWIMEALWFDLSALPTFSDPPTPPNSKLLGMSEAQLALEALSIEPTKINRSQKDKRTVYRAWLFARIGGESRRVRSLGAELKRFMLAMIDNRQVKAERRVAGILTARFFDSLPQSVNAAVHFTRSELRMLDWETFSPVSFGNVVFNGRKFWPIAQQALAGQSGEIIANTPHGEKFKVSAGEPSPALFIAAEKGATWFRVIEPALALVPGNAQQRLKCLTALRADLDRSISQAESTFPKLARTKRVDLLMRDVLELRSRSVVTQLQRSRRS